MRPKIRASRPAALVRTPGTSTGRVSGFREIWHHGDGQGDAGQGERHVDPEDGRLSEHPEQEASDDWAEAEAETGHSRPDSDRATRAFPEYVSLRMDSASADMMAPPTP